MKDLLVVARIHTLDPARPAAEAVAVRGGRVACLGSEAECARLAGPGALRIAAGSAVPGLADAHGHVQWLGQSRRGVDCEGAPDEAACAARAAERARSVPPGTWIRGRGWDQNRWPGARFPTAATLSAAVPHHPVILNRVDGHALWVNQAALAAARIGPATPDPAGGRIERDAHGAPTGVLVDAAQDLVRAVMPAPSAAEIEDELLAGLAELAAAGLTSVHDAGVGPAALDVYRRLAAEDRLPLRVHAMIDGEGTVDALRAALDRARAAPGTGRLAIRAVKLFADGALGSRGAALFEDYADEPGNRGLLLTPPDLLREKVRAIAAGGFQPAVHAIGDRALAEVIAAFRAGGELRSLRPRLEHLQIAHRDQLAALASLGAIASMQPVHAATDVDWAVARLGPGTERLRGAYAWRSAAEAGLPLAFGSDFPVASPDPRAGLAACEERRAWTGLAPGEALGREEALRAFTAGVAYAERAEGRRGMLREGLDADLTLFAGDVMACSVAELKTLPIAHTIVAGRVEWSGA